MTETSGHAISVEEIEAHIQALVRLMPKGSPDWAKNDLTFGQLRLLFTLGQSGPISIGQLAEMLGVTAATASELVDRVERRGLVSRRHRADDRRVVESQLSEEGVQLLVQIAGTRQQATREALSVLDEEELADLGRLLRAMAERLAAARTDAGSRSATTDAEPRKETIG